MEDNVLNTIIPGIHRCPNCKNEYIAEEQVFPENDIRHEIECPYCNYTVGYAEGTHDIITRKIKDTEPEAPICPECHIPLVLRMNHRTNEVFWGCNNYSNCHYTQKYTKES